MSDVRNTQWPDRTRKAWGLWLLLVLGGITMLGGRFLLIVPRPHYVTRNLTNGFDFSPLSSFTEKKPERGASP